MDLSQFAQIAHSAATFSKNTLALPSPFSQKRDLLPVSNLLYVSTTNINCSVPFIETVPILGGLLGCSSSQDCVCLSLGCEKSVVFFVLFFCQWTFFFVLFLVDFRVKMNSWVAVSLLRWSSYTDRNLQRPGFYGMTSLESERKLGRSLLPLSFFW